MNNDKHDSPNAPLEKKDSILNEIDIFQVVLHFNKRRYIEKQHQVVRKYLAVPEETLSIHLKKQS